MTGLDDEIQKSLTKRRVRNRLHEVADALDKDDRAAFIAALNDKSVPAVNIVRVMQARGFVVGESTISNYRRGLYEPL